LTSPCQESRKSYSVALNNNNIKDESILDLFNKFEQTFQKKKQNKTTQGLMD
jgi:hypothetical protein